MGALSSSDVSADDQILASQYNSLIDDIEDHSARHITSGEDEVDGDKIDVDWDPSNYTPATTPAEADDTDDLSAHLYGIDQKIGDLKKGCIIVQTATSTLTNADGHRGLNATTADVSGNFEFRVPSDFTTIEAATIAILNHEGSTETFAPDIYSYYGASGEAANTHTESKTDYSQSIEDTHIYEWDISPILSSIAAGDCVGIKYTHKTESSALIIHLRFEYT